MSDIGDYQVDHLLLLVGSNPLPNAVAGKLLLTSGGTITLIHSKEGFDLAQRLQRWFDQAGYSSTNINFKNVEDESDANLVEMRVYEALDDYERKIDEEHNRDSGNAKRVRIGLNYTGGTKVMAVHAHLAVKNWLAKSHRNPTFSGDPIFSYLDARTLHMRFDPVGGQPAISFPVGRKVEIDISDLLRLHNWKLEKSLTTVPMLPQSAAALLSIHSNPNNAETWRKWLYDELFRKAKKPDTIAPPFWVFQSGKELQESYDVKQSDFNSKWKNNLDSQTLEISWPDLPTVRQIMSNELGLDNIEHLSLTTANGKGCEKAKDFCKWLSGLWLESAVLSVLQDCVQELQFNDCAMNIKPKVPGSLGEELFQFDAAAIRGYQLFAFSCTTDRGKSLLKQKLFEVYVRARQMGGDEACAALVCCAERKTARILEEEMRRDVVVKGHIHVFSQEQLVDLAEHIKDWVKEQSKDS